MIETSHSLKQQIIENFGTPCAVVDLDRVESNIAKAQAICDAAHVANRPHIKTHKSPLLARMQLDAGAQGITCQKLGEAEVMANEGINDIVVATNLLGASRSGRLASLQKRVALKVCADSAVTLAEYARAARSAGRAIDVLVECDTGQLRAGVETPHEALKLAQIIKDDAMLNFAGLLYYPSINTWHQTQAFHDELVQGLTNIGLEAKIVSTGGTPNLVNVGKLNGATEHRAGTCIFNDRMMIAAGVATLNDCAFEVYTSVVSRAGSERGILDAGSKTFTSDTGGLEGFGYIIEHPDAVINKFSEEHGFLDLSKCQAKPVVGDIVRVVPNHVCVSVNMFEQLIAVRDNRIEKVIPVAARGKLV